MTRFVGRSAEREFALSHLRAGRGLLFTGPAGIGKSRLIHEVHNALPDTCASTIFISASAETARSHLGVFASFLGSPGNSQDSSPIDVTRAVAQLRSRVLDAGTTAIFIDNAHLLDPTSSSALHGLALVGVRLVAGLRSEEELPVLFRALLRGQQLESVHMGGLSVDESASLLTDRFDGEFAHSLVTLAHSNTAGNPLHILELIGENVACGAIQQRHGIWTLVRELSDASIVVESFERRIAVLPPNHRRALQLVALAGIIPVGVVRLIVTDEILDSLEKSNLVLFTISTEAFLSVPPALRRALTRTLPPDVRAVLSTELDAAFSMLRPIENANPEERASRAVFRMEAGLPVPPGELLTLAELMHSTRPELVARFVEQALVSQLDLMSRLRVAQLLVHQHDLEAAEEILAQLDSEAIPPQARSAVLTTRAFLLAMPGQRPEEALRLLDGLPADHAGDALSRAVRATALWRQGRFRDAAASASEIFHDESAAAAARAQAGLTLVSTALAMGEHSRIETWWASLVAACASAAGELPEALESARLIYAASACYTLSHVSSAESGVAGSYRTALLAGNLTVAAQYAHAWGMILMLCGRPAEALDLFSEALGSAGTWSRVVRPWLLGETIGAMLALGRVADASALADELRLTVSAPLYDADLAMVEAGLLAARGDFLAAERVVFAQVAQSRDAGAAMIAARLLYFAVRWGSRAAAVQLAGVRLDAIPGSGISLMVDHAVALRDQNPGAMVRTATALERCDLGAFALDASAQAVSIAREAADFEALAIAWGQFLDMSATCLGVHSLAVVALAAQLLTPRERQVSLLAANGKSDTEIAAQLGISERTVQTHLSRAFTSLSISSRRRLPSRLSAIGLWPIAETWKPA